MTVCSSKESGRTEARRPFRSQRGGAVAELAVAMPFVFLMVLGAVDFGRMWTVSTRVDDAAYAGATYGAQSTTTAKDTAGMRTIALHELGIDPVVSTPAATKKAAVAVATTKKATPSEKDYDVTTTRYCECEDQKSVDCDKGTCVVGTGNRRVYVRVRVGTTFRTVFNYPGIPQKIAITRQTQMRAR